MSGVVANPPADLGELRPGDEMLTADELRTLSLFHTEHFEKPNNSPSFQKFPGTTVLRFYRQGDAVCAQGDAALSAFYILTAADLLQLRQTQLAPVERLRKLRGLGRTDESIPAHVRRLNDAELAARQAELQEQLRRLQERANTRRRAPLLPGQTIAPDLPARPAPPRRVAAAKLLVDRETRRGREGLWGRLTGPFRGPSVVESEQASIPIDGPTDLDARSLEAPLHEGELFGEMSVMNRSPRSATVIVEQDCWMLEMLRNVLDMLHRDPKYRQRMDEQYRERVLEMHVRRLSVFRHLTDAEFQRLQESIELVEFEPGAVIFEEHDPSDEFYVVRSGLVKVLQNVATRLRPEEFDEARWQGLCRQIAEEPDDRFRQTVRTALAKDALDVARRTAGGEALDTAGKETLLGGLNGFICTARLQGTFGKTTAAIVESLDEDRLREACRGFPDEPKNWSDLEVRLFHRELLELAFPDDVPHRLAHCGPRRILAYLGRGETLGEIGVVQGVPRSATCVAYDHPETYDMRIPDSRTGAVVSRLEMLRINRAAFEDLMQSSARVREAVNRIVARRRQQDESRGASSAESVQTLTQSLEFEQLGLIQGQELMLIDLDRCTRCGACVEACINTHDDGFSRLYLDGPRFENYLVPLTCRKCLDPVCMIGCPVGAINRGDNGEIQIRDWCIGCRVCAEQCPYGSIQMNEIQSAATDSRLMDMLLGSGASIKKVSKQAVVCDLCSSQPGQQPACVYHCPHDAALRVNATEFFFEVGPRQGAS